MATANLPRPTFDISRIDSRIMNPLHSLRGKIRLYVVLEAFLNAAIFLVVWFWVALFLDYGLFALLGIDWVEATSKSVRGTILAVVVIAFLAFLLSNLLVRLLRDFSARSLALVLERRFPKELGDRLITAVELSDVDRAVAVGYSKEMILKTIADVKEEVEKLPVSKVLNWRRLWLKLGLFFGILLGGFLLIGVGYAVLFLSLHMRPANPEAKLYTPGKITRSFTNLASMCLERNMLLQNNLWPRRYHVEIKSIPADQDTVHLGPNKIPYQVKAQAYRWVVVDSKAPQGIRAMTWKDAEGMLGSSKVPFLALGTMMQEVQTLRQASVLSPAATELLASTLEIELTNFPSDASKWELDRLEELLAEKSLLTSVLSKRDPQAMSTIQAVLDELEANSQDPYSLRTFRKLSIPEKPELRLRSRKSRIDVPMKRGKENVYFGDITKTDVAKLSGTFTLKVSVGDYSTPEKQIELVPPPSIVSMKRTEYQPAYLYYFPILDDTRKPLNANPEQLKGLRQKVDNLFVSLTDKKCRFEITTGTDVTLTVEVDKPLATAFIVVKNPARFPGMENLIGVQRVPLKLGADAKTVSFDFSAVNQTQVQKTTDFEFEFNDTDDVSSTREVQIQPIEDPIPDVEVVVDSLRKVGNSYMCTPKALIPFAKESRIKDAKGGLNRVEYRYSYSQLESGADLSAKASFIGLLFHNSPQMPSIGQGLYRAGMIVGLNKSLRSENLVSQEQAVVLKSFQEEWEKRTRGRLRLANNLNPLLDKPLGDEAERDRLIQNFDFNSSGNAPEEGFDLEKLLPNLAGPNPEIQPNYLLNLSVVAIDSNVESGEPRMGMNKEPLSFRIVSHLELLGEIAREQSDLANKLREVIRRLERNQKDLFVVSDRLRSIAPMAGTKDDFIPEQTRMTEMTEAVTKSHDMTSEVHADYARILKELITNRFDRYRDKTIKTIRDDIVSPLQESISTDFPATEDSLNALLSKLNQATVPEPQIVTDAQTKISALLEKLRRILEKVEDTVQLDKLIDSIKELKKQQENIGASMKEIAVRILSRELAPVLTVPPTLALAPGEKKTLTIDLNWTIEDLGVPYSISVQPAVESDLKVSTTRIEVKGAPLKLNVEVTGGTKKGDFTLRIIPNVGNAVETKVSVK
jgi:peptidoglycan hydrolase-like protein with peptidoglycan-binding domain